MVEDPLVFGVVPDEVAVGQGVFEVRLDAAQVGADDVGIGVRLSKFDGPNAGSRPYILILPSPPLSCK